MRTVEIGAFPHRRESNEAAATQNTSATGRRNVIIPHPRRQRLMRSMYQARPFQLGAIHMKTLTRVAEILSANRSALLLTAAVGRVANITAALSVGRATTRCLKSITLIATSAQMRMAEQVAIQTTCGRHHAVNIATPSKSTTQALIASTGCNVDPVVPLCCRLLP